MLSWPDFEEKQIIFIEPGEIKNLKIKNGNLAIVDDGKILNQISLTKIFVVLIEGNATFTSVLIQKLLKNNAIIILLKNNFSPYCVIGSEAEGNTILRKKQYVGENNFKQSKWIVNNKIQNQILLIKKIRKKSKKQINAIKFLKNELKKIEIIKNLKELLGLEGNCSKVFFQSYFEKFNWHGRKPRTKFDEMNCLFDIGYTFLFNFIDAHLRIFGFDIYRGFYHTDFYQRKSLACDLMEPFRCIIDYALYRSLALKKFDIKDFEVVNNEYHIKKGCSKKYIQMFLQEIMLNKEGIFKFLQSYYRNIMRNGDDLPIFLIKK